MFEWRSQTGGANEIVAIVDGGDSRPFGFDILWGRPIITVSEFLRLIMMMMNLE